MNTTCNCPNIGACDGSCAPYNQLGPATFDLTEARGIVAEAQPASIKERWNIERDGDALLVCFNDHEKGEACRYERFVPEAQPASVPAAWQEFVERVSKQRPEKPDYWSSCGQCEHNISDAEDLLAAAPQAPQPAPITTVMGLAVYDPPTPQPEAQPQWQPIETAPKDGRKMLLTYTNSNGMRRIVVGGWVTDDEAAETDTDGVGLEAGWYERIDNWGEYYQVVIHEGEPTHWMPLPAAPSAQAEPQQAADELVRLCPDIECGRKGKCSRLVGLSCISRADTKARAEQGGK